VGEFAALFPEQPSGNRLTDSRLANLGATALQRSFLAHSEAFRAITRRAQSRFENRDWAGQRADAQDRLAIYRRTVDWVEAEMRRFLGDRIHTRTLWAGMKAVYSGLIEQQDDWELAETFFNSITRRIFTTVGVDPQIEFVDTDFEVPPVASQTPVYRSYTVTPGLDLERVLTSIIADYNFRAPGVRAPGVRAAFADLPGDLSLAAARIHDELTGIQRIDMVCNPFFRGMAAYLVGRMATSDGYRPIVLALLHEHAGIYIDAILLDENSTSILFSFARSYFHVEVEVPYDLVRFLATILPRKRIAELYISLGYNKHGKTELYRDLLLQLAHTQEQFHFTPGKKGMVMTVFTMPGYDLVFKIIKDRFTAPKTTTRRDVIQNYELVFRHDRAGRLIDAQVFEYLQFSRERFDPALLEELLQVAGSTVQAEDGHVIIRHAYIERRVTPLDLYLQDAQSADAGAAIIDYGQAIKDLAAANIFPGDMLLKNFGVTRHGRIVFYDYDELRPLTHCRFRRIPVSRHDDDELSPRPWFHIDERDIFPEEFLRFMGLPPTLEPLFIAHHGDLLQPDFWLSCQQAIHNENWLHIRPYLDSQRLRV